MHIDMSTIREMATKEKYFCHQVLKGFAVLHGFVVTRSGVVVFFFSSRRRHTRFDCDWSSDVCSSDLTGKQAQALALTTAAGVISWFALPLLLREPEPVSPFALIAAALAGVGLLLYEQIGRASCRERV